MTAIITCTSLTKTYSNGVTALDKLTLTIEEGMSFGLMGFIFPTRGSLNILGESDARRAHPNIGYLHERPYCASLFSFLCARWRCWRVV